MDKEILILILNSGEKLLANVSQGEGVYMCENVMQIMTDAGETGQMRLGLMEYLPFANKEAGLAIPTNMAAIAFPNDDLKLSYQTKFGLIITPPASKIIL